MGLAQRSPGIPGVSVERVVGRVPGSESNEAMGASPNARGKVEEAQRPPPVLGLAAKRLQRDFPLRTWGGLGWELGQLSLEITSHLASFAKKLRQLPTGKSRRSPLYMCPRIWWSTAPLCLESDVGTGVGAESGTASAPGQRAPSKRERG